MPRHRTLVRLSRAVRGLAVIVAAAAGTTALFQADLGRELVMPPWRVATAPAVLYLAIALVGLRHLPLDRRVGWALSACGVNIALALVSAITLSLSYPMSLEGALSRVLWTYVPAPIIHLVAAPLVLLGWRSRLVPLRAARAGRAQGPDGPAALQLPEPELARTTPNWDAVLRPSLFPALSSGPGRGPFERAGEVNAPMAPEMAPAPPVAPSPPAAPADAPPVHPVAPVVATSGARPPATAEPDPAPDEPMVRVPLLRVAAQLPPDVFVLPPERLAESLREPQVLLVPRRLVLPQLAEGTVEIAWTLVEDQFPELALAISSAEVRRRFPGWRISLPMDEVVRQIPPDLRRVTTAAPDLSDISAFPAPFTPGPPAPEATATPPLPTVTAPEPTAILATLPSAPVPPTSAQVATPARSHGAGSEAPAPALPLPAPPVRSVAAAPAPPPAAPAPPPAAPAPLKPVPVVEAPVVRPGAPEGGHLADEESEALARALALGLSTLGAFDWHTRRLGGRPVVSFVAPVLAREAIDEMATSAAALADRLSPWALEQMTIRTSRLACVITPLGTRGCLVATIRRNGAVAMLELMSARAARDAGLVPAVAATGGLVVVPTTADSGNGHRRLADAARALAAFGPVAASVAEPESGAPRVYVFARRDAGALAGIARGVHAGLVAGHNDGALGRLETISLRRGRERLVVRPLGGAEGARAILAAAGEVTLTGRAHRAVARAAALLEAR